MKLTKRGSIYGASPSKLLAREREVMTEVINTLPHLHSSFLQREPNAAPRPAPQTQAWPNTGALRLISNGQTCPTLTGDHRT